MLPSMTRHAVIRAQQRGVPTLVTSWLLDYGEEAYDGRGGVVRFFGRDSLRRLKRDLGEQPVRSLAERLRSYLVQSSRDGVVLTVGKRYRNRHIFRQ